MIPFMIDSSPILNLLKWKRKNKKQKQWKKKKSNLYIGTIIAAIEHALFYAVGCNTEKMFWFPIEKEKTNFDFFLIQTIG